MYRLASLMLAVSLLIGCGPSQADLERQRRLEEQQRQDAMFNAILQAANQEAARNNYQQQFAPVRGAPCKECGAFVQNGIGGMTVCPDCVRASRFRSN